MRILKYLSGIAIAVALALTAAIFWWEEYYRQVTFIDTATPIVLVDEIQSYWSVDQFAQYLEGRSQTFKIGDEARGPRNRPPYTFVQVQVKNYRHHGVAGLLTVTFFNNRLSTVVFYPADVDVYLKQLASETKLDLISRAELVEPQLHWRVWVQLDHTGKKYVGWEDTRLRDEMSLWIRRYS